MCLVRISWFICFYVSVDILDITGENLKILFHLKVREVFNHYVFEEDFSVPSFTLWCP